MADFSKYTVSIDYDRRLYKQDIAGSTAHAKMLAKQSIISQDDASQITRGLKVIEDEIRDGTFPWNPSLEDDWRKIADLSYLSGPISRMAISPNGNTIAVVVDAGP